MAEPGLATYADQVAEFESAAVLGAREAARQRIACRLAADRWDRAHVSATDRQTITYASRHAEGLALAILAAPQRWRRAT
ncbi:hypothetical protein ACIRBX_24720 [Kitasatospora sp. NPDC096147]|uniref:hypothetical protein n=1 Tax=Kitasatospora sp. NPDC096147 TaxID=3364093 RepID=UPI00381CC1B1